MSIALTVKNAYEVASIAGAIDELDVDYYCVCGIISKKNLCAIKGRV